jgi:predicted transcriptional regulator
MMLDIYLETELEAKLDHLAIETGRNKRYLACEAILKTVKTTREV